MGNPRGCSSQCIGRHWRGRFIRSPRFSEIWDCRDLCASLARGRVASRPKGRADAHCSGNLGIVADLVPILLRIPASRHEAGRHAADVRSGWWSDDRRVPDRARGAQPEASHSLKTGRRARVPARGRLSRGPSFRRRPSGRDRTRPVCASTTRRARRDTPRASGCGHPRPPRDRPSPNRSRRPPWCG